MDSFGNVTTYANMCILFPWNYNSILSLLLETYFTWLKLWWALYEVKLAFVLIAMIVFACIATFYCSAKAPPNMSAYTHLTGNYFFYFIFLCTYMLPSLFQLGSWAYFLASIGAGTLLRAFGVSPINHLGTAW